MATKNGLVDVFVIRVTPIPTLRPSSTMIATAPFGVCGGHTARSDEIMRIVHHCREVVLGRAPEIRHLRVA